MDRTADDDAVTSPQTCPHAVLCCLDESASAFCICHGLDWRSVGARCHCEWHAYPSLLSLDLHWETEKKNTSMLFYASMTSSCSEWMFKCFLWFSVAINCYLSKCSNQNDTRGFIYTAIHLPQSLNQQLRRGEWIRRLNLMWKKTRGGYNSKKLLFQNSLKKNLNLNKNLIFMKSI